MMYQTSPDYTFYPNDDVTETVEVLEYDSQGRVVKRTTTTKIRRNRGPQPYWQTAPTLWSGTFQTADTAGVFVNG